MKVNTRRKMLDLKVVAFGIVEIRNREDDA